MLKQPPTRWRAPAQLFNWTHCLVHHTAALDDPRSMQADNVIDYHVRVKKWRDAGYHFLCEMIENTPVCIILRPLTEVGSHSTGWNTTAVGVVFAGNYMEGAPPDALIQMSINDLFRPIICGILGITKDHIYAHREVKRTACPGDLFPMTLITDHL